MTTPIQQTIVLLEQEVEALEQKRGELLRVIDSLRPLAGEQRQLRGRVARVVIEAPGRSKKKTALKRNERTNERTSKARANADGAAEPP